MFSEATENLPVSIAGDCGLRDHLRGDGVIRNAQTVEEDGGDGTEVPTAPRIAVSAASR